MDSHEEDAVMADANGEGPAPKNIQETISETENVIETLEAQLANLKIREQQLGLQVDATLIGLAQADVNQFLNTIATEGAGVMDACDGSMDILMDRSLNILAQHLDAAKVPTFFVPTEGSVDPLITLTVHRDGKIARLERLQTTKEGWTVPQWTMYIGPREEIKNVVFRRATPASDWISDLIDWSKAGGDVNTAPPPRLPLNFRICAVGAPESGAEPRNGEEGNERSMIRKRGHDQVEAGQDSDRELLRDGRRGTTDTSRRFRGRDESRPAPKRSVRDASHGRSKLDPRNVTVARFLALIQADKVGSIGSQLPENGAAYFDFMDNFKIHTRRTLTSEDFQGKTVVLLLGTSVISHFRLSSEGFGLFMDLGGEKPRELRYPTYDFSYLCTDDPDTVIIQCGMSGWHTRFGPNPRGAHAIKQILREHGFEFANGFRIDVLAVQVATNDLKFSVDGVMRLTSRPKTDRELFDGMLVDCRELHDEFRPSLGTIVLGLGTAKWRVPGSEYAAAPLHPKLRMEEQHWILDKCSKWLEERAADDVLRIRRSEAPLIVHSPLRMLPPEACVVKSNNFGHVNQSYFGDMALNTLNAVRNGMRLLNPRYRSPLLHCYGIPRRFGTDLRVRGGVHPRLPHEHGGVACDPGVTTVQPPIFSSADMDRGTWFSLIDARVFGDLTWTFW